VGKRNKATTTFISLFSSSPCPFYAGKRGKDGKATTTFINVVVQLAVLFAGFGNKPLLRW
jgi:hypothetical protein